MVQQHDTSPVREAVPEDAPRLLDLELSCPQGSSLVIASHRKDYFFRTHLYGSGRVLVAEDREQKRLIGAVAGTIKEVLVGGKPLKGAFFYDLRVHPDYRRSVLGRHMLKVCGIYGRYNFFPEIFRNNYISEEMKKSGLFSCLYLEDRDSFASIGLFRVNRTMGTRVLALPGYYKALKPILDAAGRRYHLLSHL